MTSALQDVSFFCFMQDVLDRGAAAFCDDLAELGATGVTVASRYHAARDLRPRGARSRVADWSPGARYFPVDESRSGERMPSWSPAPFGERDVLAELAAECGNRGMRLAAWTVFGFDERSGRADPSLCQRTAFGDAATSDLCPANPHVVEGYRALSLDVVARRPQTLLAESLHYHGLRLSRRFVPMDAWTHLALGLCFCEHCATAAAEDDVDAAHVAEWARDTAGRAFAGETAESDAPIDLGELDAVADGELGRYLESRTRVVNRAVAAVADVVESAGSSLCFMDQAAAGPAVVGPGVLDEAFRSGVDPAGLASLCDGYEVLGYRPGADAVAADLRDYRAALGPATGIRLALRPTPPDSATVANLEAKLRVAVEAGVSGVDFYHYGLVSDDALDRVREAVRRFS